MDILVSIHWTSYCPSIGNGHFSNLIIIKTKQQATARNDVKKNNNKRNLKNNNKTIPFALGKRKTNVEKMRYDE